jgi:signal transduction histidine kinase
MSAIDFLTLTAQLFFILLGGITVVDYLRYRDNTRRDIALMFSALATPFVIQVFTSISGHQISWLNRLGILVLVAQPYLLLRLVQHFRSVTPLISRGALMGVGLSWMLVIVFPTLPVLIRLAMFIYFVGINGYAALAFIQSALTTIGVVRHRLRFASMGSGLLAALLVLIGLSAIHTLRDFMAPLVLMVGIASALAFYLGFAPPRWLLRTWQLHELHRFLLETNLKPLAEHPRAVDTLGQLCRVANRAIGNIVTGVAQRQGTEGHWILQNPLDHPALFNIEVDNQPVIERVWREQVSTVIHRAMPLDVDDQRLLEQVGAGTLLVVPIATGKHAWGLLLVFLRFSSLFIDDDLELLTLFAQQSALILENYALVEDLQKHNRELEQTTAQLSIANRELEAFSYSVSHDLRAPLRAVNGFTQILLEDYSAQFPAEAKRYLQLTCENARQMGQLIDDLLSFSRLSRQPLRRQEVSMAELVRQVIQKLQPDQPQRQMELLVDDLPVCLVDPVLINQVLLNLLSNALKYTRNREMARVEIGCQKQNGNQVFFVKDNGVGFDMRYSDKLFGVFQRLHRVEEYEGTGVGLAIVQRIIQRHGGTIWAEAAVDQGATFYFTLGGTTTYEE